MTPNDRASLISRLRDSARGRDTGLLLPIAIIVSLVVHAGFLLVTFTSPPPPERATAESLEVVLVNARHASAPDQADVLAQTNLDGGGTTTDDNARPSTPTPPSQDDTRGEALVDAARAALPEPTPEPESPQPTPKPAATEAPASTPPTLTTPAPKAEVPPPAPAKPKPKPTEAPKPAPSAPAQTAPRTPSGMDLMNSIADIARLEAQIDRQLNEYAQRPRKVQIGARAREYRFAQYVEDWRQKVERIGTLNYPDVARGRLYGSLVLTVAIRADGHIERVDVDRSSGHAVLDAAAVDIVRMASPYSPFPPDIRADTDIIEITRTWTFTNSDQVRTR